MHRSILPGLTPTVLAGVAALAVASCTSVPAPQAGSEIARAVGLEQAVELRVDGDPVDAQPPTSGRLTLVDAVRLAVERDAQVQAALARVRVALADAKQARLLPNPILILVLRWPEGGGPAEIEAGVAAELAALLKRPRRIDAADRRLLASVAEAVAAGLDSVAGLRQSYAAVQALDELLPLFRERRSLLDRLVAVVQARVEFGEAAGIEVTPLEAQRAELDVDIADLELRRRQARLELARRIGEPSSPAEWALDPWASLLDPAQDERTWISTALARRPELQALVLELAALGDEAALAALQLWDGSSLGIAAQRNGDWSVGPEVSLPIPVFDTGTARRERARAEILAVRHELVDLTRRVVEQVRRALAEFRAANANLQRVRDELVPLQRRRREEVEANFLGGLLDVTALLLAERDLQTSQAKLVELEQRSAASLVQLERAVGGPAVVRDVERGRTDSDPRPQP